MPLEKYKESVKQTITDGIRAMYKRYSKFDTEHALDELDTYIRRNGKLIRPTLMLLVYELYGGHDYRTVSGAAAAIELFHLFALAHDDIIDGDTLRSGQPSLGTEPTLSVQDTLPRRIILGDILHSLAWETLAQVPVDEKTLRDILLLMSKTAVITGLGVIAEPVCSGHPVSASRDGLFDLYDRKTGYYTFAGPMTMGYRLAGGTDTHEQGALTATALLMGRAYQLIDDYRDGKQSEGTEPLHEYIRSTEQVADEVGRLYHDVYQAIESLSLGDAARNTLKRVCDLFPSIE
ncbi:MAG: polyprenyl synthetase family protein [Spirochaetota bacterium]